MCSSVLRRSCGGVQDIGCDDQVERMRIESLLERITLDIERAALQERIAGKLVLRMRE